MHVIKFIIKDGCSKFCLEKKNCIRGIIVSVLTSSVADRGFINGVMVSMLTSSVADRGFWWCNG